MAAFFQGLFGIWRKEWNQLLNGYGISAKNKKVDAEAIMSGSLELDEELFNPTLPKWIVGNNGKFIFAKNSNFDRIRAIEPHYKFNKEFDMLKTYKHVLTKNLDMAQKLKATGEVFMKSPDNADLQKALRAFNLASSFVPMGHQLLIEISNLRETIINMEGYQKEKALALGYTCADSIEEKAKEENSSSGEVSETEMLKKYRDEVIFKVHGAPSKIMPSASHLVLLKYSQNTNDRSLVASEDIQPGTTLIVEDPYVAVFDNEMAWEFKNCSFCFKKINSTIPCDKCVFAVYCSEECRDADFASGHRFECPCLEYIFVLRAEPNVRLCLKAVCKAGCAKLIELMKLNEDMDGSGDASSIRIPGVDPTTGVFSSNSYYTLSHLKSHIIEDELLAYIYIALTLAHILDSKSEFFAKLSPDQLKIKDQIFTFVAASILDSLLSFPYNVVDMTEEDSLVAENQNPKDGLLTGVYATFSMMNHSCDPNAFWVKLTSGKMAVITARQVKAGEEITISYGFEFTANKYEERLEATTDKYKFPCKCLACELKWPVFTELGGVGQGKWICSLCVQHMNYSRKELIKKCTLSSISSSCHWRLKCKNCNGIFPLKQIYSKYTAYSKELLQIAGLIKEEKLLEAITRIKDVIPYFQYNLCPPSIRAIESQELLQDAIGEVLAKTAKC